MQGEAKIAEVTLVGGRPSAYIICDNSTVPAPGRYLLAHEAGSDAPLATELFAAEYRSHGFVAAPPLPSVWLPGAVLDIRGPLGNGFVLPPGARRVALIAFNDDPAPLLPLVGEAVRQAAAVALVCANPPLELPLHVEVHPPAALRDICMWSDYAAFIVERDSVDALVRTVTQGQGLVVGGEALALIRTPMPCGGLADCGVCTVRTKNGPRLACVDGPVFELGVLSLES
jgi:dihydroorotate dehydrogenase electron transfer subunit